MKEKPIILLTNHYSNKVLKVVKNELPNGFDFISLDNASKDELVRKAKYADYFLASGRVTIDKEVIQSASKLKMIQRTGVGTDTLDLITLQERNIPVYVNTGINSVSVAEHTILLMLSVLRRVNYVDTRLKSGFWEKNDIGIECHSINNKIIGLIGIGNIGKNVVKMLQPFGVTIFYNDLLQLDKSEEQFLNVQYCEMKDLLKHVDILTLHCPLTPYTRGIIGEKEIAMMKQGSFIINSGRGQLIDEKALIAALQSGHIRGAGLDVFAQEPVNKDNPLLCFDNVVLTPHIGGLTIETFSKMMSDAFDNIQLFENKQYEFIENKRLK